MTSPSITAGSGTWTNSSPARFAEHPHADIITSIDGFGPVLGAELLADTGGDLAAAFGTPDRLAAYAGLAPVPRDSGRVRGNLHRPQRYHRGLRRVFYLAALSAIKRTDGPSRAYYQRKRGEREATRPSPDRTGTPTGQPRLGPDPRQPHASPPRRQPKQLPPLDAVIETPLAIDHGRLRGRWRSTSTVMASRFMRSSTR